MNSEAEPDDKNARDDQVATVPEAQEAIRRLSKADRAKLMIIAKFFARHRIPGSVVEAGDLLHDAIVKTLDGTRKWNKRVSIMRHLDRTMESDSSHVAGKFRRSESLDAAGEIEPALEVASVHAQLIARRQLEEVLPLLEGAPIALEVLRLRGDGFAASEIREKLSMSDKDYDTVSRRIRRLREKLSRGGE